MAVEGTPMFMAAMILGPFSGLIIKKFDHAISKIPADADLVITHEKLTGTALAAQPNKQHLSISNYLKAPEYDELVERLLDEQESH